jgi:hypothetical protein
MPTLELEASEIALLRMLLKRRLSGLNVELDHTDSREFKELLRRQREELERLERKLAPASS